MALPLAAILCIVFGSLLFVIIVALIIRSFLKSKGKCKDFCTCCEIEENTCCLYCAESCGCYDYPTRKSCFDAICPRKRKCNIAELIMCKCCACCNDDSACDCAGANGYFCFCFQLAPKTEEFDENNDFIQFQGAPRLSIQPLYNIQNSYNFKLIFILLFIVL